MKTILTNITADTQTTYANNGKTTLIGRVSSKTLNSKTVLGAPLTKFIDTQTLVGVASQYTYYNPNTNRLWVCGTIAAATTIMLFNFNATTGDATFVGRIIMNLPNSAATTYTPRGFAVYESGGTATVLVSATGTVAINSGIFMANKVPIASFTVGGTNIWAASTTNEVAVYQLQDSLLNGVLNPLTTSQGVILPQFSPDAAVNTKVWQWNGTLAASQLFAWDLATNPQVGGLTASGQISSQVAPFANTSPAAYFTMPTNNAGFNATNDDPVVVTGTPPPNVPAWVPGTLQTTANVRFLRDLQQQRNLTVSSVPKQYTFTTTATSAAVSPGAQYTNNSQTFTVNLLTATAATTVLSTGTGAPLASGTLTLVANQFVFTSAATLEAIGDGATYTNNAQTFTFTRGYGTGTASFVCTGTGAPIASGTLTLATGTGPATITFSAFSATVGPATITYSVALAVDERYQFNIVAGPAAPIGTRYTQGANEYTLSGALIASSTVVNTNGAAAPAGSGNLLVVASQFTFTVPATASQIVAGTVYTHNAQTYTVGNITYAAGITSFTLLGSGAPILTGGTLTLSTGTGPASIVFTAAAAVTATATIPYTSTVYSSGILAAASYVYTVNGTNYTITFPTGCLSGATSIQGVALTGNPAPIVMQQTGVLVRSAGVGPEVINFSATSGGAWFFNLGPTAAGAAVIPSASVNTFDIRYAFGITYNQFVYKTAPLGTAFALGTILNNQNTGHARPMSVPAFPALQNQDCIFMGTTTGLYMGLISDLSTLAYAFTIAASNVTAGAVYMQNNQYFTVRTTITGGTSLSCFATGAPSASGVLTKVSGTGPDFLQYSGFIIQGNTWTSMNFSGVNMLGTGADIVPPLAAQVVYGCGSGFPYDLEAFIINQSPSSFVAKPYQSNNVVDFWGGQSNTFLETKTDPVSFAIFNAVGTISTRNGWFFISQPTQIGQRGIISYDISSDGIYQKSGIISPVVDLPLGSKIKLTEVLQQLEYQTGFPNLWVRSGSSLSDANFSTGTLPIGNPVAGGTISNGWTSLVAPNDVESFALGPYYQFCITFQTTGRAARMPLQVQDLVLSVQLPGEASEKWAPSVDNSTQSGNSPMYVAWRLQVPYATSVPQLYVKGYDDAGNVVASFNTVANAASFSYSTNNGGSWTALGTIPNTAFTTEVRVLVATPPVTNRINWSITES